jgi:acetyltransferase
MTIRHLDQLLEPASVAVFGASERPGSVGATVWRNILSGRFIGPRWPVNPKYRTLGGVACFADAASLAQAPDLAVICTPPATVPQLIAELGARGTRAAIVLSAGFDAATRQAMLDAARPHVLRILGPNCLGLLVPHIGLNASFAHTGAEAGSLAFVSQSGALVTAMLDWAGGRGIGFSHFVSLGEHADVDFADMLDWLASCPRTRAILMYAESIEGARKFMSAARAAARNKPVLIVKAGRSAQGQAAAASHTGALAASDLVLDAAIRRAGMLRVDTLQDLFDAAETLSHFRGSIASEVAGALADEVLGGGAGDGTADRQADRQTDRATNPADDPADDKSAPNVPGTALGTDLLTLVTNGGGAGVMAADAAAAAGMRLARLSEATLKRLDAGLPANWSRGNPVDIIGDAPVERYVHTLRTLLAAPEAGTLLFMHAPTAIVPSAEIARAIAPLAAEPGARGRLLASWLGGPGVAQARQCFEDADIACHDTPEAGVRAFARLTEYRANQVQLMQVPPSRPPVSGIDTKQVAALIDAVLAQGRELLSEPEAKALLAACGVPVVPTRTCGASPLAAAQVANEMAAQHGWPLALKVLSPQISHKSDVGGVVLDLASASAVANAAQAMLARVAQARADAVVTGFTLQPMVRRPRALELIVGTSIDPQFGPVLLFGQGGTAVEVVADRAIALPPLNAPLAQALIRRTRVARLLDGFRDVPPADTGAVAGVLTALSELLALEPRIAEIDINPLLADAQGVMALDARVRVSAKAPGGAARFAIQPYPLELAETVDWQGSTLTLRPIRPEDEPQHRAFFDRLEAADLRMRFFYSRRTIARSELARLTQIDYAREMAFIATRPLAGAPGPAEETLGVVRALCDPDSEEAEFAVIVRSDLKGGGLGELLMRKLIAHLRQRGTKRVVGDVLKENARMLELARDLGFSVDSHHGDPDVVRVSLAL